MLNSEVLYGAAAHIDVFGHCKFRLHGGNPQTSPACAIGAILVAGGCGGGLALTKHATSAMAAFDAYLNGPLIHTWNNAPERTPEEVSTALRAAALIEAATENPAKESAAVQVPAEVVA